MEDDLFASQGTRTAKRWRSDHHVVAVVQVSDSHADSLHHGDRDVHRRVLQRVVDDHDLRVSVRDHGVCRLRAEDDRPGEAFVADQRPVGFTVQADRFPRTAREALSDEGPVFVAMPARIELAHAD